MNRLIIKFNLSPEDPPGTLDKLIKEVTSAIPGRAALVRGPSKSGRVVFAVGPGVNVARLGADLARLDKVVYAEPDVIDSAAPGDDPASQ